MNKNFQSPSALEMMDAALKEVSVVSETYNHFNFRKIEDDRPTTRGISFSHQWAQKGAQEPQTLWGSLPTAFAKSMPEDAQQLAQIQQINFQRSELRDQLIRVLQMIGNNQPCLIEQARAILARTESNLKQIRRCAEILMLATRDSYSSQNKPIFQAHSLYPSSGNSAYEALHIMEQHFPKKDFWSFDRLQGETGTAKKPNDKTWTGGRYITLSNSTVPRNIVAHHIATTREENGARLIRIRNFSSYKMSMPDNCYSPDITAATIADMLAQYYQPLKDYDLRSMNAHPQITNEVQPQES